MTTPRSGHSSTLLTPSGKVLIAGGDYLAFWINEGCTNVCWPTIASAELFDPTSFLSSPASPLTVSRTDAGAVLLPDGKVLMIGGSTGTQTGATQGPPVASVERFDPSAQTFEQVGSLLVQRRCVSATLLGNGKILVLGSSAMGVPSASAEIYDPVTNTSMQIPDMLTPRNCSIALRLLDGRVLVGDLKPELFE